MIHQFGLSIGWGGLVYGKNLLKHINFYLFLKITKLFLNLKRFEDPSVRF
jgi:hypothetical protein